MVRVLVAGASGFVGRRLCPALTAAGHEVIAMTRSPGDYRGAGTPVYGDVLDADSLAAALAGCQAAYYLVHSLGDADFERKDALGAIVFGQSAKLAGLTRVVYLGALGRDDDTLSAHLRSRRDVESRLGSAGVPMTVVRAGIIVGDGGFSWEMTRQLVEHLRVMVTPRWVATRTQPIALDDVVRYLLEVLVLPEAAGRVFEVGGPEILQYGTMLRRVAAHRGSPAHDRAGSGGQSSTVLAVADPLHRRRHRHGTGAHRLDDQRGRGARPVDPRPRTVPPDVLQRRRPQGPRRGPSGQAGPMTAGRPEPAVGAMGRDHRRSTPGGRSPTDRLREGRRRSGFGGRRRIVAVSGIVGAGLLGLSFSRQPGSGEFYVLTA